MGGNVPNPMAGAKNGLCGAGKTTHGNLYVNGTRNAKYLFMTLVNVYFAGGTLQARLILVTLMTVLTASNAIAGPSCFDIFSLGQKVSLPAVFAPLNSISVQKLSVSDIKSNEVLRALVSQGAQGALEKMNNASSLVADRIQEVLPTEKISTVLYPAAGYDAGTPFLIFPSARLVIGWDTHPFMEKTRPNEELSFGWGESTYTNIGAVNSVSANAGIVSGNIARLQLSIPNFRLRRVLHITEESSSHGLIEFDSGLGTPVRTYVHMHGKIPSEAWEPNTQMANIFQQGFDGLLIKGAFGAGPSSGFRTLLEYLKNQNGVVVDTDNTSYFTSTNQNVALSGFRSYSVQAQLGYGGGMESKPTRIIKFDNN